MVKDEITFADFQKLDLRVGKIIEAESVDGSVNLILMQIDLGDECGKKKIIGGLSKWYKPQDLIGKKVIVVANLAPKQMMKEESHGMILCVDMEGKAPYLIQVDDKIPSGTVVR